MRHASGHALALALLALARPLQAQLPGTGRIRGTVAGSDGPVANATILLRGADRHATTDGLGRYQLEDVAPGVYALEVTALGFQAVRRAVRVGPDTALTIDVSLNSAPQQLADVSVTARAGGPAAPLPDVYQGLIYAGKKTELLQLDSLDVNAAQNVSRQVLGRVPGLNVAETEGAGFPSNGIGFRGLNPTQSTEVNVRQDGYNIAADPYGYPEVYFAPPAEALETIELVRGASSLGFGSQFGGMVNYVIRDGRPNSRPAVRTRFTGASYASFDGFGDVGGGVGSLTYYGFVDARSQQGWRPNGDVRQITAFGRARWQASSRWRLGLEYTLFRNRIHMPGGLTNETFAVNPDTSFRSRNWLGSPWNILALTADFTPSADLTVRTAAWGNLSQRYLVWRNEDGGAGALDNPDPASGEFVPREVERERFTNATLESRLTWSFPLLGRVGTLAAGVRAFAGRMHRQGGGPGSAGTDFDLTLYGGPYEYDITFYNTNLAGHVEQLVRLGDRLTVTPGVRLEYLRSTADGYTDTTFAGVTRSRTFALPGVAAELRTSASTAVYGDVTRAYHPVDYSSLTPFATVSRIDPRLHDARGLSADLGWRGRLGESLRLDVSGFWIRYADRIGLASGVDADGTPFTLRTNVATSVQRGVEAYLEMQPLRLLGLGDEAGAVSVFDAFAFTDARYVAGEFSGNDVEYAPRYINRLGIGYARRAVSGTIQLSSVSRQFGDANNTLAGTDANVGLVPAYRVIDLSARVRIGARYEIGGGVNNLADVHYFTRRTDEYPGPGIIPSPGRSLYLSAGATF